MVIVGWSLVAGRLSRLQISGAFLMVVAGIVIGLTTNNSIGNALDTDVAEPVVELILALLLFVDAIEVRGGYFAGERRTSFRLLLVAMPLSVAAATLLGLALLPSMSVGVALLIACVVIPMDLTPATSLVRDHRFPPTRVRHLLNIESGYNDGIIAPIFIFALTLAGDHKHAASPAEALEMAVPSALWAALAGSVIGLITARLTNLSVLRGLATEQSVRISLVLIPILAYGCSVQLGGNGFVAPSSAVSPTRRPGRTGPVMRSCGSPMMSVLSPRSRCGSCSGAPRCWCSNSDSSGRSSFWGGWRR